MFTNDVMAQEILSWINDEGHFKEMTLTTAGELFVDPAKNTKADECWLYYKSAIYLPGSLYVSCDKEFCTFGEQLKHNINFPLMKNKTEIGLFKQGEVGISSRRAGIPNGSSLIAFIRYRGSVVLIVAGDAVKRRSWTVIMEATTANDSIAVKTFNEYLELVNHNLASKLAASQFALKEKNLKSADERSVTK